MTTRVGLPFVSVARVAAVYAYENRTYTRHYIYYIDIYIHGGLVEPAV